MKITEAATYLSQHGYPCAAGTVRALVRLGKIRHRRIGASGRGRVEITEAQLDAFLKTSEIGGTEPTTPSRPIERRPRVRPTAPAVSAVAIRTEDRWAAFEREMKA